MALMGLSNERGGGVHVVLSWLLVTLLLLWYGM